MNRNIETICVIGLGYIGLPTAALLANRGHRVKGVDVQQRVVDTINRGEIHIVEPDLDSFVRSAVGTGALTAHTAAEAADVFVIAVPTPLTEEKAPQMEYVWNAARMIAPVVKPGNLVILESTSPVGTTEKVGELLAAGGVDLSGVHLAHCPERVLPGRIMIELSENDRIVGGMTPEAGAAVAEFYRSFVVGEVLETTARTAEMTKLVENASRDVQIAFANELSLLSDRFGVDVWEVIEMANHHPRVNILRPGPGVGGHCIAVDPWFLVDGAPDEAVLIRTARERNLAKTDWVVGEILRRAGKLGAGAGPGAAGTTRPIDAGAGGGAPAGTTVAVMGLAYKPDIDDLRESPALYIARQLKAAGVGKGAGTGAETAGTLAETAGTGFGVAPTSPPAPSPTSLTLRVCEPNIESHDEFELFSPRDAVAGADLVVFLVAHREFRDLDTRGKEVMDVCGVRRSG